MAIKVKGPSGCQGKRDQVAIKGKGGKWLSKVKGASGYHGKRDKWLS